MSWEAGLLTMFDVIRVMRAGGAPLSASVADLKTNNMEN